MVLKVKLRQPVKWIEKSSLTLYKVCAAILTIFEPLEFPCLPVLNLLKAFSTFGKQFENSGTVFRP
jgi:hypothetical protein